MFVRIQTDTLHLLKTLVDKRSEFSLPVEIQDDFYCSDDAKSEYDNQFAF
jgi:hypothetical protein